MDYLFDEGIKRYFCNEPFALILHSTELSVAIVVPLKEFVNGCGRYNHPVFDGGKCFTRRSAVWASWHDRTEITVAAPPLDVGTEMRPKTPSFLDPWVRVHIDSIRRPVIGDTTR